MGYFANGTEADFFQDRYCIYCKHWSEDGKCPVWDAHLDYGYKLCDSKSPGKIILDMLIPVSKDGLDNAMCAMFIRHYGRRNK